jgi:lipopolysaccharide exporter
MDTEQREAPDRVGSRALKGGSLLAAGTAVERLARLGRNMLLARIIAPDQFGLMAIVLAVLALLEAVTEVGVAQAVIQNKRGTTVEFLNVAWWFGIGRGVLVAALALPLAGPVADFYDLPELAPLLMVAPLSVVLIGLSSPRIYALQREFRFGASLVSIQGAGLIATVATVALGLWLQSVWALLWGTIIEAFLRFVLSFVVAPFRPSLRWDPEARGELFLFTRGMAGLSLLTFLMMHADTFVLGKTVTVEALGLYTMAITLAAFPLMIFSKVVQPLVVPLLARLQDDMAGMRSTVLRLSRLVWLFGLPMAAILATVSEPLLVLVYGRPEFSSAAPAFSVYALFTVVYMASMVTFSVYLAIGRPALQRRFTVVRATLLLLTLYPLALRWGGTGAAVALLLAMLGAMAVQLVTLRRVIGLGVVRYLRTIPAGLVSAAIPVCGLVLVLSVASLSQWVTVALALVVGIVTWGLLLLRERHEIRRVRHGASESPQAGLQPGEA